MKIAFLNPNFPPRAVPLLNRISKNKNIDLLAIIYSVSQRNRRWKLNKKEYGEIRFNFKILNSKSIGVGIHDFHNTLVSFDIFRILRQFNPDIVLLPGWSDINSFFAFLWAKKNNKTIILRSESTHFENNWRRTLFLPYTKYMIKQSDLLIGSSQRAVDYAKDLAASVNATRIYSSFDTEGFSKKVQTAKKHKTIFKQKIGITQSKVVYFNGQLIKRKGLLELLDAFKSPQLKKIALLISGHGHLQTVVKSFANKQKNVYYLGYLTQDKLPQAYATADIFILPSYEETWGLVIIEALASGLPIITTKYVGASDLIGSRGGVVIDSNSADKIKQAILKLLSTKRLSTIIKRNKTIALNELNYDKIANQFIKQFTNLNKLPR